MFSTAEKQNPKINGLDDHLSLGFPGLSSWSTRSDMAQSPCKWLHLMVFLSSLFVVQGKNTGAVYFVETGRQKYLQSDSQNGVLEESVFSEADVAASVAVLLGVDPPSTMTQSSASKLERLFIPDPFHRPRRVVSLVLEAFDLDYLKEKNVTETLGVKSAEHRLLTLKVSKKAAKHLGGKDVRLESLNYPVPEEFDLDYVNQELQELFGISIEIPTRQTSEAEVVVLSLGGRALELDLSKISDYQFLVDLISLSRGVKRAIAAHKELGKDSDVAELFFGTFSGLKALKRERQPTDVSQASELVLVAVSKIFHFLEALSNGELVGVVTFPSTSGHHVVRELVGKHYHSRTSRFLKEEAKKPQTLEQLTRRTLAASTAIILIIASLLGTCCMCYMPLSRDSLLYMGAKLD